MKNLDHNSPRNLPKALRTWFVIHFLVDMAFALPLLFFPEIILPLFGWDVVDPVMSRLVGAALLGIGGESLLSRKAGMDVYRALLSLKIIWASAALLAIGLGLFLGAPPLVWIILVIFAGFLIVWIYFYQKLS
jgi:hypothetical protein